jgi:hypothetical protein
MTARRFGGDADMATGMLLEMKGLDQKRYERINEILNLYQDAPKGLIMHCAGPMPGGWRVFDIWESRERFDQFHKQRLERAFKEAGVNGPPSRQEFFEMHNVFAPQPSVLGNMRAPTAVGATR